MKKLVLLSVLFFFSRLLFLNPQPVFFDAPEYLERMANPDFLTALASGHPPFHAGYILINWLLYQLAKLVNLNLPIIIEIFTVILGFLTIFFFYRLLKNLFNQKLAFWASLLVSLTPYFWITNVSVMIETPYIFFFILSLYLFSQYLKCARKKILIFSSLAFGFAYFIHTLVLIWVTAFISVWLLIKNRKKNFNFFNFLITNYYLLITLFVFYLINVFLFYHSKLFNLQSAFIFGLFGKTNEHLSLYPLMTLIPRLLRNWLILLARSNTNLLLILFFLSLFLLWRKGQRKIFWAGLLWFLPSFISNQWWDSVLLGRHALLASFPISLIVVHTGCELLKAHREKLIMVGIIASIILYLLFGSLGSLVLLRQPIPYLELARATAQLPAKALLLETHFSRPQTTFAGEKIFINQPGWPKNNLTFLIDQKLANQQPVFATSQALADPYGLYSGPYLNPLSLNPKGQPELKFIFDRYHFEKYATVDEKKRLFIYQIKPKTTPDYFYRDFKIPYFARERIDYFDPLTQLWLSCLRSDPAALRGRTF